MTDIKPLTGIRFLAAFYVFLFHIDMRTPFIFLPNSLQQLVRQGAIGVNVFFTLSGFILAYTYLNKSISYNQFFKKRLVRIYPAYAAGSFLCLLVSFYFTYFPSPFIPIFFANIFMVQSYFPPISMRWYGGGSWSISTEFFFYLLFPILLSALKSVNRNFLYCILALSLVASSVPGWVANRNPSEVIFFVSYTFPLFRLPEFLSGMVVGILVFKYQLKINILATVLSIVFAIFCLVTFHVRGYVIQNVYVLPAVLSILALVATRKGILIDWLGSGLMVYLGKISYGFYIIQVVTMLGFGLLFEQKVIASDNYLASIIVFLITLLLSMLMYKFIESPIHERYSKSLREGRGKSELSVQ
jgi:peptidoglycan/LPS O-acetylase OafA/YrhL